MLWPEAPCTLPPPVWLVDCFACQEMSHCVKLKKTDFVSSFWGKKRERGNGGIGMGMGTGTAATGTGFGAMGAGRSLTGAGRDRDKCLRERDGRNTEKLVPCKTVMWSHHFL